MTRAILLLAIAAASEACPPSPAPVPPSPPMADAAPTPPPPTKDASAPIVDAASPKPPQPEAGPLDACGKACAVLASLNCPESKPTPHGVSCHDVCAAVEGFAGLTLHPGSVAACGTIACVRKAGVSCKQ